MSRMRLHSCEQCASTGLRISPCDAAQSSTIFLSLSLSLSWFPIIHRARLDTVVQGTITATGLSLARYVCRLGRNRETIASHEFLLRSCWPRLSLFPDPIRFRCRELEIERTSHRSSRSCAVPAAVEESSATSSREDQKSKLISPDRIERTARLSRLIVSAYSASCTCDLGIILRDSTESDPRAYFPRGSRALHRARHCSPNSHRSQLLHAPLAATRCIALSASSSSSSMIAQPAGSKNIGRPVGRSTKGTRLRLRLDCGGHT